MARKKRKNQKKKKVSTAHEQHPKRGKGVSSVSSVSRTEIVCLDDPRMIIARRTAFVARFIVLRERKRSRAHRMIELMEWDEDTTAEELAHRFREAFVQNGDKLSAVDRDIKRALLHADKSLWHFAEQYCERATTSFVDALKDYDRSNKLLFGDEDAPHSGGWQYPEEIEKAKRKAEEYKDKERKNSLLDCNSDKLY